MEEIWKDVVGYEGYYQISNLGRLKSLKRIVEHKPYKLTIKERIRKQKIDTKGYYYVMLSKNGIIKHLKIHQLVATAFIDNLFNKSCVNHIDGNKLNNNLSNLEWVTYKENMQHAYKHNLIAQESIVNNINRMTKATSKPVNQIKNGVVINSFKSINEASRITKIKAPNICEVLKGRRKYANGYRWEYALLS